jgi:AcrR family transcriptional regulator
MGICMVANLKSGMNKKFNGNKAAVVDGAEKSATKATRRGRQRCQAAEAAILKATSELMKEQCLREVTADAIAERAGVSKATIYKWWPNKNRVALDAFLIQLQEQVPIPDTGSVLRDFTEHLVVATRFYTSRYGRMLAQFLAEGQSDSDFLALFKERFQQPRRNSVRVIWERAVARGEVRKDIDVDLVIDLLFGPVVYRLLCHHSQLDDAAAKSIVDVVFHGLLEPKAKSKDRN